MECRDYVFSFSVEEATALLDVPLSSYARKGVDSQFGSHLVLFTSDEGTASAFASDGEVTLRLRGESWGVSERISLAVSKSQIEEAMKHARKNGGFLAVDATKQAISAYVASQSVKSADIEVFSSPLERWNASDWKYSTAIPAAEKPGASSPAGPFLINLDQLNLLGKDAKIGFEKLLYDELSRWEDIKRVTKSKNFAYLTPEDRKFARESAEIANRTVSMSPPNVDDGPVRICAPSGAHGWLLSISTKSVNLQKESFRRFGDPRIGGLRKQGERLLVEQSIGKGKTPVRASRAAAPAPKQEAAARDWRSTMMDLLSEGRYEEAASFKMVVSNAVVSEDDISLLRELEGAGLLSEANDLRVALFLE